MDYYGTLQLEQFASLEQIKKAYKRLALKTHPDKINGVTNFIAVNEAYMFLTRNKAIYDILLN